MKVKRSCQLAVFGRRALDAKYATAPTLATKAREYAEVAVKMGGGVDMVRDVGEGWEGEKQPLASLVLQYIDRSPSVGNTVSHTIT